VTGGWRKLYNEEIHNLYSSPDIISMVKSRRMRWAGLVARMGEKRNAYRLFAGKPEGKRQLGRPRRGWVILKWILERLDGVVWTRMVWLKIGTDGRLL
jgi:hypothetical protein